MLKRYFFIAGVEHEGKDGRWCRVDDVLATEAAQQRRIDALERALDILANDYDMEDNVNEAMAIVLMAR